jgi:hypothetical protein
VAFWARVGGFVAGVALVWLFKDQAAVIIGVVSFVVLMLP